MATKKKTAGEAKKPRAKKAPINEKTPRKGNVKPKTQAAKRTAKTNAAKSSVHKQTAAEKKLAGELAKLLPLLDAEGLEFLLEQARTHLYNMQVDAINANNAELAREAAAKAEDAKGIQIVQGEGSSNFHIVCNGKYSIFNEDEMFEIARICQAKDTLDEIALRLYHWFFTERADFLANGNCGLHSEELDRLVQLVRKQIKLH